jgi:RES domain
MAKRLDALQDFDLALLGSQNRKLTQQIATLAYQLGYDGIHYQSRHEADLHNWALFEPFELIHQTAVPIHPEDPNLKRALGLLNLTLNPDL